MQVHVSIHDVAPPFEAELEAALRLCRDHGAKPALLVVPDFHGEAPLGRHPRFTARLRELGEDGHEILLHGYFHRASRAEGGLRSFVRQRVLSEGEAEMSALEEDVAHALLDAGDRALAEAGLVASGFVPPAWSRPRWLLPVLAARGCAYTEDHLHVYAPREGRRRRSLVLNFASRTPARLASSVAFCRVATPLGALAPARVAIHPGDMRSARLRREVKRLLAWGQGRFVARGRALLDEGLPRDASAPGAP